MAEKLKKPEDESRTRVIIFYESHTASSLKTFKEFIEAKHPAVIVLEEDERAEFQPMLDGKISVKQYMQGHMYPLREFLEKRYEFLIKLHKENPEIKIEQFEPSIEMKIRNMIRTGIVRDMESRIAHGDFEGGVRATVEFAKAESDWIGVEEEMRAKGIADKIKKGGWAGCILVEAGATHTRVGHLLRKYLGEDAEVSSFHSVKESIMKGFGEEAYGVGLQMLYPPVQELRRLYLFGREVSEEREKLLGARAMVFFKITAEGEAGLDNVHIMKAVGLVGKLSYSECKQIFNDIYSKGMKNEEAFRFVEACIEKNEK